MPACSLIRVHASGLECDRCAEAGFERTPALAYCYKGPPGGQNLLQDVPIPSAGVLVMPPALLVTQHCLRTCLPQG